MAEKIGWGMAAKSVVTATSVTASSQGVPHDAVGQEGRGDAHQRHPCFCLRIEYPDGNCKSIDYGTFIGFPQHYPSYGIQFVFEAAHPKHGWYDRSTKNNPWVIARWCVSIMGRNLKSVYDHLCNSKEEMIRIVISDEGEEGPCITEVHVDEMEIEVSGTMAKR